MFRYLRVTVLVVTLEVKFEVQHRSYLLEVSLDTFLPKPFAAPGVHLKEAAVRERSQCQALWLEVGRGFWTERSRWSAARWNQHLSNEGVSFWFASLLAEPVGFFELSRRRSGVKIEGFGLLPEWRAQGLGSGLLSAATDRAFRLGALRVWLHTATDDHPNALPNYKARGYRVYREREHKNPVPSARLALRHGNAHGAA